MVWDVRLGDQQGDVGVSEVVESARFTEFGLDRWNPVASPEIGATQRQPVMRREHKPVRPRLHLIEEVCGTVEVENPNRH